MRPTYNPNNLAQSWSNILSGELIWRYRQPLKTLKTHKVISFLNPWDDPTGSGYQLIASLLAFGKGGFFGLGLGSSVQKLSYLPESYNDFIFALIADELGLLFSLIIILLFVIVFFRIIRLANVSSDNNLKFASYLCFLLLFL